MSVRVAYVLDDPGWVQAARLAELRRRLPGVAFDAMTPTGFSHRRRLGLLRRRPIYFATWRVLAALLESGAIRLSPTALRRVMCSVTSHYNLGGGLDPAKALRRGTDEPSALESAARLLRECAVVTVNSSPLRDLLSPHVPDLLYAPNGVDADFFTPPQRTEYDESRIRVGWVGKVKAAKNVETIRAAAEVLQREGFAFEILAFEKSGPRERLLDAAGMRDFYRRLDYYLCASWHEGTPNPALEAAACGVPLVTTRVGNMVDFVRSGENGFFVEPTADSIVETFRAARSLERDRYLALRVDARRTVLEAWTWERNAEAYRLAFDRLLAAAG